MTCFRSLVLVCSVLAAVPSSAQTLCGNPCTMAAGQTYSVTFDSTGLNTTGFRVYVNSVQVGADLPLSALTNGSVTVSSLVAGPRGTYALQVAAFNEDGETRSDPITITTKKPAPGKPTNLKILLVGVTVASNGRVTLKFSVEQPLPVVTTNAVKK